MSGKATGPRFAVVPEDVLYAEVSTTAKVLWAILARHADPEGHCYPGRRRLAVLMGVSEPTVWRAKGELVKANLIECTQRFDENGRRLSDDIILGGYVACTRQARRVGETGTSRKREGDRRVDDAADNKDLTKAIRTKGATPSVTCSRCGLAAALLNDRGKNLCPHCYEQAAS